MSSTDHRKLPRSELYSPTDNTHYNNHEEEEGNKKRPRIEGGGGVQQSSSASVQQTAVTFADGDLRTFPYPTSLPLSAPTASTSSSSSSFSNAVLTSSEQMLLSRPDTAALPHREFESMFACAIFELGLKHSSPKVLIPFMPNNSGLSTEHIKSHLQKYRIHKERSKEEFTHFYRGFLDQNFQKWNHSKAWEHLTPPKPSLSEGVGSIAASAKKAKKHASAAASAMTAQEKEFILQQRNEVNKKLQLMIHLHQSLLQCNNIVSNELKLMLNQITPVPAVKAPMGLAQQMSIQAMEEEVLRSAVDAKLKANLQATNMAQQALAFHREVAQQQQHPHQF